MDDEYELQALPSNVKRATHMSLFNDDDISSTNNDLVSSCLTESQISQIRHIGEIFPDVKYSLIQYYLEKNNWQLDICVAELLENVPKPTPTPSMPVTTVMEDADTSRRESLVFLSKSRTLSKPSPRQVPKVYLPPDFLRPPQSRVVVNSYAADYIDYTVYIHRNRKDLDITLAHADNHIFVTKVLPNKTGSPGLAMRAGIRERDILYGVNFEYFSSASTLADAIKVINTSRSYISLHFRRMLLMDDGKKVSSRGASMHPLVQYLLQQNILTNKKIDFFNESIVTLKQRVLQWHSGVIKMRARLKDIVPQPTDKSTDKRFWMRDVTMSTTGLQAALCFHVVGAEHRDDHVQYIIWIQDVQSGFEWHTRRRYSEFYRLREELISHWQIFDDIPFPPRRIPGMDTPSLVSERLSMLNTFIRRVYDILLVDRQVFTNTYTLYLLLYKFFDVSHRIDNIRLLQKQSPDYERNSNSELLHEIQYMKDVLRQWIEIYIHYVLHTNVIQIHIEEFLVDFIVAGNKRESWCVATSKQYLDHICNFMQNLHDVLGDTLAKETSEVFDYYFALEKGHVNGEIVDNITNLKDQIIQMAIRRQVEVELYVPSRGILNYVLNDAYASENEALRQKCQLLHDKPQSFFGISMEHISPSSWEDVIIYVKLISKRTIPNDKLAMLVAAAKEITVLYRIEHPASAKSLGADDMLPIFIYAVVMAQTPDLVSLAMQLEAFCDSYNRLSETGYFIATLQATIEHIRYLELTEKAESEVSIVNAKEHHDSDNC